MRHPLLEFVLSTALVCALAASAAPAPATPAPKSPTKTLKAVPNFVTVTDQAHAGAQAFGLGDVSRQLSGLGLQPARADQQDERQDAAARLVARHGARHQPGDAARLQRRDVSRQSRRRDPGDRCRDRRSHLGVPAPAAAGRRCSSNDQGQTQAQHRALWRPRLLRHLGQHRRRARRAHRRAGLADRSRRRRSSSATRAARSSPTASSSRAARARSLARLLRHRPRCRDRQGALAQRDDSAPGRARRRDLGRLAVREPLDDRRLGSAHLRSRARSRLLRIERRRPRLRGAAQNAGRDAWPAPTRASRCGPRPARSSGGIRCCRATTGTRNARSR